MPDPFLQKWQALSSDSEKSEFIRQALLAGEQPEHFAELPPKFDRFLETHKAPLELLNKIQRIRKQKELKLQECLKPRRGFSYQKSWFQLAITDQRDECPELSNLLADPGPFIRQGHIIKTGKATTVAVVTSGKKQYFIKRYNSKGFLYSLTRSLIPSRAAVTWHATQLLESIGIPTARPVALLEKRWGPFKQTSYVIHEYVESIHAMKYFAEGAEPQPEWPAVAQEIDDILYTLKRSLIIHGDLKAHNFIIQNHHAFLIDLDSLKSFQSEIRFFEKHPKDLERFDRNWKEEPKAYSLFSSLIKELRDNV
ncbi:lipopolysaccharide kinase InaA family protein [Endozoicomonas sp. 8E]|uniref:lipopolysaccharide kinase InaA family protein n=1 Tax=Endozoicomonas sp. 8E TaxID=3035692 RepID=UPI002938E830|nr:lipopolysaccharide kinase InaA family protein [Endozoicomonas sp. 8E]WOG28459.1 lipopolysaccharide kinase InaA family protein [Endozoicomonas sp. 8E]